MNIPLDACPMMRKYKPLPQRNYKKKNYELGEDDLIVQSFFVPKNQQE